MSLEISDNGLQVLTRDRINAGKRLIQQNKRGTGRKDTRDLNAAALASGTGLGQAYYGGLQC